MRDQILDHDVDDVDDVKKKGGGGGGWNLIFTEISNDIVQFHDNIKISI